MQKYKLAFTDVVECRKFMEGRKREVEEEYLRGLDRALALAPERSRMTVADMHNWVEAILKACADASDAYLPGLIDALDCILSMDERSSESLVDERRRG